MGDLKSCTIKMTNDEISTVALVDSWKLVVKRFDTRRSSDAYLNCDT